jgi:hypothetical protein
MDILLKSIYMLNSILIKIPMTFFTEIEKSMLKFIYGSTKDLNGQSKPEWKQKYYRYHNVWLQIVLQSHSNKNIMILAQKQTQRPIGENERHRDKFSQYKPFDSWQKNPKHILEKDILFNKWSWKTGHTNVEGLK